MAHKRVVVVRKRRPTVSKADREYGRLQDSIINNPLRKMARLGTVARNPGKFTKDGY